MRFVLLMSCSLFLFSATQAQNNKSKKDTVAKVIYSEIVKVDSANRFDLYKKAVQWVQKQKFEVKEEDALTGKVVAKNRFEVVTDKGVLAKPNGDFTHEVLIDVKDGKYRYTFTNFTYRQYKQDRNLKYVPVKGTKPIEESNAPGWKKQWGKNKMQVNQKVEGYIASLREAMKYVPSAEAVPVKPKEEW